LSRLRESLKTWKAIGRGSRSHNLFRLGWKIPRNIGRPAQLARETYDRVKEIANAEILEILDELLIEFKNRIRGERFNVPPLKPEYVDYKRRQGLRTQILMATEDYINGIVVEEIETSRFGSSYTIKVEDRIHAPSGLPLEALRRIHEHGSASVNIPARPIWRIFFKEMMSPMKQREYSRRIKEKIRREF